MSRVFEMKTGDLVFYKTYNNGEILCRVIQLPLRSPNKAVVKSLNGAILKTIDKKYLRLLMNCPEYLYEI